MNVLSLCAGVGGLDLGVELATGGDARTVCFVEREAHAAAVLVSRMEEALLAPAAVWSDLTTFDGREWRGVVDLVVAGYPCQPFSTAGKRAGVDDPRHLWPHVARIIRECGAGLVLLENVPGHLSLGFDAVCGDLQGMGYRVAAGVFSAAEVGASHRRERLFIMAHRDNERAVREFEVRDGERKACWNNAHGRDAGVADARSNNAENEQARGWEAAIDPAGRCGRKVADADQRVSGGYNAGGRQERKSEADGYGSGVAQSLCGGLGRQAEVGPPSRTGLHEAHPGTEHHGAGNRPMEDSDRERGCCGKAGCEDAAADQTADRGVGCWPPGPNDDWSGIPEQCWPATEPDIRGVADGMAARVDRLRACGNGVVPLAAAHAFRTLTAALAGCVEEEQ